MSAVGPEGRSFAPITTADLARLAAIAATDRQDFFRRHPDWGALYEERIICSALCQGAALHHVRGDVGINDFDVYTFYAVHPERRWYAKRLKHCDFADDKFGRTVEKPMPIGRRVDLMGRDLPISVDADPIASLQNYLMAGHTPTARALAAKAVVILEPAQLLDTLAWPIEMRGQVV